MGEEVKRQLFIATVESTAVCPTVKGAGWRFYTRMFNSTLYTRMFNSTLDVTWTDGIRNVVYGYIPRVPHKVGERRMSLAEHCMCYCISALD